MVARRVDMVDAGLFQERVERLGDVARSVVTQKLHTPVHRDVLHAGDKDNSQKSTLA